MNIYIIFGVIFGIIFLITSIVGTIFSWKVFIAFYKKYIKSDKQKQKDKTNEKDPFLNEKLRWVDYKNKNEKEENNNDK